MTCPDKQTEEPSGRLRIWDVFKHILRVQFMHPPHPPLKIKGRHRATCLGSK